MNNHDRYMAHCVLNDPNVAGFLSDNAGTRELVAALEAISEGCEYYSSDLVCAEERELMRRRNNRAAQLTLRELEVVRLIEQEFNNRQIATALFISERTVETHRKHIYQKTRTNNVIGLIKYAYSHKLVD